MKLDFELDIARKEGCTVQLVAVVVRHMMVGFDFPLWVLIVIGIRPIACLSSEPDLVPRSLPNNIRLVLQT